MTVNNDSNLFINGRLKSDHYRISTLPMNARIGIHRLVIMPSLLKVATSSILEKLHGALITIIKCLITLTRTKLGSPHIPVQPAFKSPHS